MKQRYEMEERNIQELAELEEGETDQCERRKFRVPRTGALLEIDNAKGHLGRFCQLLSSHSYAEMRSQYIIQEAEETGGHNNHPLLRAKVILPRDSGSSQIRDTDCRAQNKVTNMDGNAP
jgi:hypothetical protein